MKKRQKCSNSSVGGALAALLALLLAPAAAAQVDMGWARDTIRKQRAAERHVEYRDGRYYGRTVRSHPRKVYHPPARTRVVVVSEPACRPRRRVIGEPANTRTGAERLVKRRWLHEVGYEWGIRYANIDRAGKAELHCNPSAITQFLKRALWTCVIEAWPCRATEGEPLKGGEFQTDAVEVD